MSRCALGCAGRGNCHWDHPSILLVRNYSSDSYCACALIDNVVSPVGSRSLQYPSNGHIGDGTILSWWGNTVWKRTADYNMTALRSVKAVGEDSFG